MLTTAKQFFIELINSELLADVIIAIIILIITTCISHALTSLLRRLLRREDSPLPQSTIFINIGRVCVWGVGLSVMLATCFGIDVSGIITALGVGGIAISLGMKDTISNLIGGLQMSLMKTVQPGDHVEIGGKRGVVSDISWRHMTVETSNGQTIIIPNSTITNGTIIKLPPIGKIVVPFNLLKSCPDVDATVAKIEADVRAALSEKYTLQADPKVNLNSVDENAYSGSLTVCVNFDELEYADTATIKNIAVCACAKSVHYSVQ